MVVEPKLDCSIACAGHQSKHLSASSPQLRDVEMSPSKCRLQCCPLAICTTAATVTRGDARLSRAYSWLRTLCARSYSNRWQEQNGCPHSAHVSAHEDVAHVTHGATDERIAPNSLGIDTGLFLWKPPFCSLPRPSQTVQSTCCVPRHCLQVCVEASSSPLKAPDKSLRLGTLPQRQTPAELEPHFNTPLVLRRKRRPGRDRSPGPGD